MDIKRENDFLLRIKKEGDMRLDALVFANRELKMEESALLQLANAACLPSAEYVLGMPDIHHGYGVPIGSVVATREIIIPAAVGYDVNCGMRLMLTSLSAGEVDVNPLADGIKRSVPLGEGKKNVPFKRDDFVSVMEGGLSALVELSPSGHRVWEGFDPAEEKANQERVEDRGSMEGSIDAVPENAIERGLNQLGTMGGGNHFIELQKVEEVLDKKAASRFGIFKGQFTIMVHSGSRAFGHDVGGHYMKMAKSFNKEHGSSVPGLSYFPLTSRESKNYIHAMHAAANFAFVNRALMAALVRDEFKKRYSEQRVWQLYDVPHNMAKLELHHGNQLWVHRKGSTRAFDARHMKGTPFADVGQPVLIPGSMGTSSYVLLGVPSGEKSLYSVNHGAGRLMSRSEASGGRKGKKKKSGQAAISDSRFRESMEGVYLLCDNKSAAKEEAPDAYKDIDAVVRTVEDAGLARPVARMVPCAVLKG
ncbi:MAG: RtcB family protein [bacterium]